MLQISKVQNPPAALCPSKVIGKLPDQADQASDRWRGFYHIFQQFLRVSRKAALLLLQSVLAGIPHRLDPIRQLQVRILAGKAQRTKVHIQTADRFIPAITLSKICKLYYDRRQILRYLFKFRNPVCFFQALTKGLNMSVQKQLQIRKKIFPPGGLRYICSGIRLDSGNAFLKPTFRVQMAAGTVKDFKNQLRKASVIPPKSLCIRKGPKIRILSQFLISTVQGI